MQSLDAEPDGAEPDSEHGIMIDRMLASCRTAIDAMHRLPRGVASLERDDDVIRLPALVCSQFAPAL